MKRIFRIMLSMILCAAMLCGCIAAADAALAPLLIGDADLDQSLTIIDATVIQRYLVGLRDNPAWYTKELYEAVCDADGDGSVTIIDATAIQRELAELPGSFVGGDIWDYYIGDVSYHSTAQIMPEGGYSGIDEVCYTGVPVTFTARVRWGAAPLRYTFSVNSETVQETAANSFNTCAFTYTFSQEGEYTVSTGVHCRYGASSDYTRTVKVISLPADGRPVVMGAAFFDASRMNSGNGVLTATAAGGTAPYQYKFEVLSATQYDEYELPLVDKVSYSTGYTDQNEIDLSKLGLIGQELSSVFGTTLRVRVTVRDKSGVESAPVTAEYFAYELVA